jgi:predicted RNA-binding Zn-ribbon protein involved in translation (DUF1610 family)
MTTTVFREVKIKRKLLVQCVKCGKKLTRTIEAWQTINPYNMNKCGHPKTEQEIRFELPAKLEKEEKWVRGRALCKPCAL